MNYIITQNILDINPYTNYINCFVNIYYNDDIYFVKKLSNLVNKSKYSSFFKTLP